MGRLLWLAAALGAVGCGKVSLVPDAAIDGPDRDAFSCPAAMMACSAASASSCVDPMTDKTNCGSCGLACATGEECMTGHCTDTTGTCAQVKMYNPTATDGLYAHATTGIKFYCDMTSFKGYEQIVMGEFDQTPTGFSNITATDLQNAKEQQAFIALYNDAGGFKVITPFQAGNCCFKNDTSAATTMLFLQNADLYPSAGGAVACAQQYSTATTYQLVALPDTVNKVFVTNMAANFFTTYPATATAGCGVATNPALFWKVTQ